MKSYLPPTQEIGDLFVEEVIGMGCVHPDVYDDGVALYARAFFSPPASILPGDAVQGGVALRTVGGLVDVHPFVYRQVCTNGAILAETLESRHIKRVDMAAPTVAINATLAEIRLALRGCGHPSAFDGAVEAMRRATRQPATVVAALVMGGPGWKHLAAHLLQEALSRFEDDTDRSAFGLMNAITSLARDTRDPEHRWRLEELGGGVLALITPRRKSGPSARTLEEDDAFIDVCA